jgi:hypothetical protein
MIKFIQVIIGIEITNAYRPEKSIPNNLDSSSILYRNHVAITNISILTKKAVNIPSHLLFLFLIIRTDITVETMKEKAIIMKFNSPPP